MTTTPLTRLCDCRCPLHHGTTRTSYTQPGCACAITCSTQPMTLLAEQWGCALFLDFAGDLWTVTQLHGGQWDWENAGEIDSRSDAYRPSIVVQRHLRTIAEALRQSPH